MVYLGAAGIREVKFAAKVVMFNFSFLALDKRKQITNALNKSS
jgi:hypothetical protein